MALRYAPDERRPPAVEICIACAVAFVDGDRYLPDNSGGAIHFDCCGPERESYCNADGDPLGPDETIPEPLIWKAWPSPKPGKLPLNGVRTHPLTAHAEAELRRLAQAPAPKQTFNAGVSDRFIREDLAEILMLPSPYPTHRGKQIPHLQITEAGRAWMARPRP